MQWTSGRIALAFGLALLVSSCGGGNHGSMTGPRDMGAVATSASFLSVTPPGGATGVSTSPAIVIRFAFAMAAGMEQYVDLHRGDLAGPSVPMACGWSSDRATLSCTPRGPLSPRTRYVLHLGGGMMAQGGQLPDYTQYGPMMGGQWIMDGMAFTFTTA